MLVCALRKAQGFAAGHVVVVALADDPAALEAIRRLRDELLEPESLVSFAAIEALMARAALEPRCTSWAEHFTQRYLDLSPVASCPSLVPQNARR